MSSEEQNNSNCCGDNALSLLLYGLGVGVVLLIGFILTSSSRDKTAAQEDVMRGTRGIERKEKRAELEKVAQGHAQGFGWRENFTNKVTHISVDKAMELIVAEYVNRDTAHSVLKKRVAIVTPAAPDAKAKK
ncbi:MAG: hypothetical protein ACPGVU_04930 [Limisphaerales bacterium]